MNIKDFDFTLMMYGHGPRCKIENLKFKLNCIEQNEYADVDPEFDPDKAEAERQQVLAEIAALELELTAPARAA